MLKQTKHVGFTLIECLVVISIIAILTAMAVPSFRQLKDHAQQLQVIHQLHAAVLMARHLSIIEQQKIARRRVNRAQTVGGGDNQNACLHMLNDLMVEELQASRLGGRYFSALFGLYQGCGSDLTQPGNDKYQYPPQAGVEQFT